MKKIILFLFVLLLFCLVSENISAQPYYSGENVDWLINSSSEYYSNNNLSTISAGKGNTGIAGISDISSLYLNPASVNIKKKFQVFVSSIYKTKITLNPNYPDYYIKNVYPSVFLGGIYKINNNLQTGIIYQNNYSLKNVFKNVNGLIVGLNQHVTDGENYNQFVTHSFVVPVIFDYKWLRAGVNLNLTYFRGDAKGVFTTEYNPEGYYGEAHSNLLRFLPQIGIVVNPVKMFSFGVSFTPGFTDSIKWHYDKSFFPDRNLLVEYPWRLGFGTELRLLKDRLKFSLDYNFNKTSVSFYLKDKSNFNFGVEYQAEENIAIRGGFFTLYDFRNLTSNGVDSYDQYFITLGGTYKYKGYSFSLALMDSQLIKKTNVSHTIINCGISLDL
jgi:long-subunit fatty acid transport protein